MARPKNPNRFPDDAHDLMVNREEFEKKYSIEPNTGCWLWTGMLHRQGYGFIAALRKSDQKVIMSTAHRISYRLYCGPITKPNINHTCHNPGCVSPYHLYAGTQKDNVQDAVRNGSFSGPRGRYKPRMGKSNTIIQRDGAKKQSRQYKYSEEDIQFCRTQSLDLIQQRFSVERRQASSLRYECSRLYNWLPLNKDQ
jgi:hypothetical protein